MPEIFPRLHFGLLHGEACELSRLRHRRNQEAMPLQILAYLVVLFFERPYPKPNTVARLKSKFGPP